MNSAGRSPGNRGPSSFFSRRAHLLTTCKTGGGMPAASCALRGGFRFLRKATDNATAFADAAVIVCAIGQIPSLQPTLFSNRLRKPATGSFAADRASLEATPFSFLRKRNKKPERRTMVSRFVTPSSSEDAKGVSSTHTHAHWQVSETRAQRV